MKLKLLPMTEAFAAYNAGEESNAVLSAELIIISNAAVGANKDAHFSDILLAMFLRFIEGVRDGSLVYSPTNKATHGVNYPRICEALLTVQFERGEVKTAAKEAHFEAHGEKLNPGFLGRVGKDNADKPKPSYKSVLTSVKGSIKKVKAIRDTKANAEAKAALLLEVKALQGLLA